MSAAPTVANCREISASRCFQGMQKVFQHTSETLGCSMKYGVYIPDVFYAGEKVETKKTPVMFYLSGITCTEENFIVKSEMQRWASDHGIVVVNPDTSPRGLGPTFEAGYGAGMYLDATTEPWRQNFRMYTYFVREFVPLVFAQFDEKLDQARCGLFGHSMGGHGTLTIGLKHPEIFKSLSAFAPLCNAMESPFVQPYLVKFLGEDRTNWAEYDGVSVAKTYQGPTRRILIDQGSEDSFLKTGSLLPEGLIAAQNPNVSIDYRLRPGYDHGYFFVKTFIRDHFDHHLAQWAAASSSSTGQ